MAEAPRWQRRKTARPGEIEAAALEVFAEKGFAAARLDDIAARAGLSKAALYVYFPTKLDLFRAVIDIRAAPDIDAVAALIETAAIPFTTLAPAILAQMAGVMDQPTLRSLALMVIAEGRNFPEIATLWHDRMVARALSLLTRAIERGQSVGEVRSGDPRLMAITLVGPMMMGVLWKGVMEPIGGEPLDLLALAREQTRTALHGLLATPPPSGDQS